MNDSITLDELDKLLDAADSDFPDLPDEEASPAIVLLSPSIFFTDAELSDDEAFIVVPPYF